MSDLTRHRDISTINLSSLPDVLQHARRLSSAVERLRYWSELCGSEVIAPGIESPYTPPEATGTVQGAGEERRAVYVLGMLGYELLAGRHPWQGLSAERLRRAILSKELPLVEGEDIPRAIRGRTDRLIHRATRKDPEARYRNPIELKAEIRNLIGMVDNPAQSDGAEPAIRTAEFREIAAWLDEIRGEATGVLEILGDSGTGKTYLWETVADVHARPDELWLYVKAGLAERRPFATISRLLESRAKEVGDLLRERSEFGPLASFVRAIAPAITPVLSDNPSSSSAALQNPTEPLAKLLLSLGENHGLTLLCIDDYQWLDQHSLGVVTALATQYPRLGLVLITRESVEMDSLLASSISPCRRKHVQLLPLSRGETQRFLQSIAGEDTSNDKGTVSRIWRESAGNPMAIRALLQTGGSVFSSTSGDVLVAVAGERLRRLSEQAQLSVELAALTGTPAEFEQTDVYHELLEAGIMAGSAADPSLLRFAHDSIESAARSRALHNPQAVRTSVQQLVSQAKSGRPAAAYAAAEILELTAEDILDTETRDWLLVTAAEYSLRILAPQTAVDFVERGLRLVSSSFRLSLLQIGHEAAYILENNDGMSHYYRMIVREGSILDRARARYIWIRRNYAESRFNGAARIADGILAMLAVLDPPVSWWDGMAEARAYLRASTPERKLRHIRRRGPTDNPRATLASLTLAHLLVPTMTADRERLAMMAYLLLRIAEVHGWTAHTSLGFIAWATYAGIYSPSGKWVRRYFQCARLLSSESGDAVAKSTVGSLVTAIGAPWWLAYSSFKEKLLERDSEARSVGNWEYAAHACHLYAQAMLHSGDPLTDVHGAFSEIRNDVENFGLARTAQALAKHHQAVETLMGLGDDPVHLDGSIIREDAYLVEIGATGDSLGLAGYHIVKSLVAFYAGRPDVVLENIRQAQDLSSSVVFFHDQLLGIFLYAAASFRTGNQAEGLVALNRLRRLAGEVPEPNLHRRDIVLAERAVCLGHAKRASRYFRRGARRALDSGYLHEAAYASERLGDLTGEERWWYEAESLYRRWGAVFACARIEEKLGLAPQFPEKVENGIHADSFSERLNGVSGMSEFLATCAEHLMRLSSAARIIVQVRSKETARDYCESFTWEQGELIGSESVAPDMRLLLDETPTASRKSLAPTAVPGRNAPIVAGRLVGTGGIELAALVIGVAEGSPYAETFARKVRAALATAASLAAIVELRELVRVSRADATKSRRELTRTEQYRRQLFSTIRDAFLLVDEGGAVVFSNRAATRYISDGDDDTPVLRPELHGVVAEMIAATRHGDEVGGRRFSLDESHTFIRVQLVGQETGLAAVSVYDVSEQVAYEQQLASQERQLIASDRLASIGMFSSAIVHEISNPNHILQLNTQSLAMILSWLRLEEATAEEQETLDQAKDLVSHIQDATGRIEAVLQMVKSYGREGRRAEWAGTDPGAVCTRAVRFSRIMAAQYTDHFKLSVAEDLPPVWGDAALLEQAVVNLIRNACDALEDRGGTVEVSVGADAELVTISVCDTGRGFPTELMDHIGTPFASGRADEGGTGLGLSIVKSIVDKHSGRLEVGSGEGFSTCVSLELPVYHPADR